MISESEMESSDCFAFRKEAEVMRKLVPVGRLNYLSNLNNNLQRLQCSTVTISTALVDEYDSKGAP
jgi:hypothetical protein